MHLVDRAYSTFTKPELERLAAYRAAVVAGFYSDWDGTATTTDTEVLAWLRSAEAAPASGVEAYPFTVDERQRLERCRAAVAGGYYSDDLPPLSANATPEEPAR
jgi:hypothetical protein